MFAIRAGRLATLLVMLFLLVSACSSQDQLLSSPSTTRLQRYISAPSPTSSTSVATAPAPSSTTGPAPAPGTVPSALGPPDALFPTTPTEATVAGPVAGPVAAAPRPTLSRPLTRPTAPATFAAATTSVGDSVMQAAEGELTVIGFEVDAMKNRTFDQGLDVLRTMRAAGQLGSRVVVHLGTNGGVSDDQMNQLGVTLDGVPHVCVVTVAGGPWEAIANPVIREGAERFRFSIIDWQAYVTDHPDVVVEDGIHLKGTDGPGRYAVLLSGC